MKTSMATRYALRVGAFAVILGCAVFDARLAGAQATTIFACRNDTNGNLRYVTGPGQCREQETGVSWVSGGPAGVNGQGTPGTLPLWTASGTTLTNSTVTQRVDGGVNIDVASAMIGVFGQTGLAVDGATALVGDQTSTSPSAVTFGVQGFARSAWGVGVQGNAPNAGVRGFAQGTAAGFNEGVGGYSSSPQGFGVHGSATGGNGSDGNYANGVFGEVSAAGAGVFGWATSTTGWNTGVTGATRSAGGVGGFFLNEGGGNILSGASAFGQPWVFRVDNTGKVFANGGFQAGGADFAESMQVAGDINRYGPGDVLVIDPHSGRRLSKSREAYATSVAGIYSTKPGVLGTPYADGDRHLSAEVPVAIVGIVPCKVSAENGAIKPGDLLVTSSMPGFAMKGTNRSKMLGAIVGKALEPLDSGTGVILVLVMLQ